MRLLASDLGTGKVAPANDLSSGHEVLNGSDDLALRFVVHRPQAVTGAIPFQVLSVHAITLKPSCSLSARPAEEPR
jgi:hypothetical protein